MIQERRKGFLEKGLEKLAKKSVDLSDKYFFGIRMEDKDPSIPIENRDNFDRLESSRLPYISTSVPMLGAAITSYLGIIYNGAHLLQHTAQFFGYGLNESMDLADNAFSYAVGDSIRVIAFGVACGITFKIASEITSRFEVLKNKTDTYALLEDLETATFKPE